MTRILFVCHFVQNVFLRQTNIIDGSKDKTAGAFASAAMYLI